MLALIGRMYELAADRALLFRGGDWFGYNHQVKQAKTLAVSLTSLVGMVGASQAHTKETEDMDVREKAEATEKFEKTMKSGLFRLMAPKIEATVASAVGMCCADTSVSKEVRRQRAYG